MSTVETARPPLRVAPPGDQPGPLEHLQVLRHRLQADRERLGDLVDRGLALGQAGEDGTARAVGERRENQVELILSLLTSYIVFKERSTLYEIVGMAMIVIGIVILLLFR